MKLYVKQDVMSAIPRFSVKDESGKEIYIAKGKGPVMVGLQLVVYDMNNTELGRIEQKKLSLKPTFSVFVNGTKTATIVKKFTAIKQRYVVDELSWTIEGDFLAHDYEITDTSGTVATIRKEWFAWGDAFEVDLKKETHVLEALAVVFAIDQMVDTEGNGWRINGHGIDDVL